MSIEVEFRGAKELEKAMHDLMVNHPDEINKAQKEVTRRWRKDVNSKFPSHYATGKRPFSKNWKCKNEYGSLGVIENSSIGNKSPHWHLVELGHRMVTHDGREVGFVSGKHFVPEVNKKYQDIYPEELEKAAEKAMKGAGL